MTIEDQIDRRIRDDPSTRLVRDHGILDPTTCRTTVQSRSRLVERLLDAMAPVFSGSVPPTLYVWGPKGAGKSTLTMAIVQRLRTLNGDGSGPLYTTTRATHRDLPRVVPVDLRHVSSEFSFYRRSLTSLVGDEAIPSNGTSTAEIRDRLHRRVTETPSFLVVDHLDDPSSPSPTDVEEWLSSVVPGLSWIGIGRRAPAEIDVDVPRTIEIPPYRSHALVDVLRSRAEVGLAPGTVTREQLYSIADWACGDAHDAISALFSAAILAETDDAGTISDADVGAGIDSVPSPSTALHRVFSLPETRQKLLSRYLSLSDDERRSVDAIATALADDAAVDLERSTIRRVLYELADDDVLRRVRQRERASKGRPPSRLEPAFPPLVFRRLYSTSEGRSRRQR